MMFININALTMEEAEFMLKVIDKWACHFYNVYGVKRIASYNARANEGRAQIRIEIPEEIWNYIKEGLQLQMVRLLDKRTIFYQVSGNCYEYSTCESDVYWED